MTYKPKTNLEERLSFVRDFPLFNSMSDSEIFKVSELIQEKIVKKHQFIYRNGDACDSMYFLYSGVIKVGTLSTDGREVIKSIIHPKAMFGEWSLLGEEERTEFAITMDKSAIYFMLDSNDFRALMEANFDFAMKVMDLIGKKLRNTEKRLESLIIKDARSRIIDFLKDNAKNFGRKVGYEMLLKHSLTQQDIANFTGTSRQTVTSVLNDLRRSNKIYFNRKSILIRDMAGLQ